MGGRGGWGWSGWGQHRRPSFFLFCCPQGVGCSAGGGSRVQLVNPRQLRHPLPAAVGLRFCFLANEPASQSLPLLLCPFFYVPFHVLLIEVYELMFVPLFVHPVSVGD